MTWYQHQTWDEDIHREFYDTYKKADKETQAKALIEQADILSDSSNNNTLKAAESLLLLWVSEHYDKYKVADVYELIMKLCQNMGDQERARDFESKLKALRPK